jgi:Raf kinase inhibitor-like YbhB/YbcL family protein
MTGKLPAPQPGGTDRAGRLRNLAPMPADRNRRPRARRATRAATAAAAVLVLLALLAGCGTSGRTLRDPKPGATAPPRKGASTTTTAAPAIGAPTGSGLAISSTAWSPGGQIPIGYTCEGQEVSPPLTISGAPAGTVELVLVVTDQDAAGFVHWVVAGIPPGTPSFPQGTLPPGAIEAPNSGGGTAWVGPCPPSGATHVYDLTVYALDAPSGLGATSTQAQVDAAVAGAVSTAAMTGTYTRS